MHKGEFHNAITDCCIPVVRGKLVLDIIRACRIIWCDVIVGPLRGIHIVFVRAKRGCWWRLTKCFVVFVFSNDMHLIRGSRSALQSCF